MPSRFTTLNLSLACRTALGPNCDREGVTHFFIFFNSRKSDES